LVWGLASFAAEIWTNRLGQIDQGLPGHPLINLGMELLLFCALFVSALLVISKPEWLLALYPRPDIDLELFSRGWPGFPGIPKLWDWNKLSIGLHKCDKLDAKQGSMRIYLINCTQGLGVPIASHILPNRRTSNGALIVRISHHVAIEKWRIQEGQLISKQ
jgi:hypothetical protein